MIDIDGLNAKLISNNCVISIHIDMEFDELSYSLLLTLSDSEKIGAKQISLFFRDVSNLHLSEIGGGLTQFMNLKIERLNSGLDRIRYSLIDVEGEKISFGFSYVNEIV